MHLCKTGKLEVGHLIYSSNTKLPYVNIKHTHTPSREVSAYPFLTLKTRNVSKKRSLSVLPTTQGGENIKPKPKVK